jgi:hypothetical protein
MPWLVLVEGTQQLRDVSRQKLSGSCIGLGIGTVQLSITNPELKSKRHVMQVCKMQEATTRDCPLQGVL